MNCDVCMWCMWCLPCDVHAIYHHFIPYRHQASLSLWIRLFPMGYNIVSSWHMLSFVTGSAISCLNSPFLSHTIIAACACCWGHLSTARWQQQHRALQHHARLHWAEKNADQLCNDDERTRPSRDGFSHGGLCVVAMVVPPVTAEHSRTQEMALD